MKARLDTIANSMSLSALQARRCIVPRDAFCEWKAMADGKQPIAIARNSTPYYTTDLHIPLCTLCDSIAKTVQGVGSCLLQGTKVLLPIDGYETKVACRREEKNAAPASL